MTHLWEVLMLVAGAVIYGTVQNLFRSKAEQGKRIGMLEKFRDFERGRQAGLREAARNRGRDAK